MAPRIFSKSTSHKITPSDEELPHTVGDEFEAAATQDEVFGRIEEDGPNYRDVRQHLCSHIPRLYYIPTSKENQEQDEKHVKGGSLLII